MPNQKFHRLTPKEYAPHSTGQSQTLRKTAVSGRKLANSRVCVLRSIHYQNLNLTLENYLHLDAAYHFADKAKAIDGMLHTLAYLVRSTLVIGLRLQASGILHVTFPLLQEVFGLRRPGHLGIYRSICMTPGASRLSLHFGPCQRAVTMLTPAAGANNQVRRTFHHSHQSVDSFLFAARTNGVDLIANRDGFILVVHVVAVHQFRGKF